MRWFPNQCDAKYTSVCLIYYHKSPADSKKSLQDMKILNIVSYSPTRIPIISKVFWTEISAIIEISTNFDRQTIIEFQIYSFISAILQAIIGKKLAKRFEICNIRKTAILVLKIKVLASYDIGCKKLQMHMGCLSWLPYKQLTHSM